MSSAIHQCQPQESVQNVLAIIADSCATTYHARKFICERAYRSPNTSRLPPAVNAMYCLPFTAYVIGPIATSPPAFRRHSTLPVRASKAWKNPSLPPVNTRSVAVLSTPLALTSVILNSHLVSPDNGSIARRTP